MNTEPHQKWSSNTPASTGPITPAMPAVPALMAMAVARSEPLKHVGEDRQCRGHDQPGTDTHDRAHGDEL